MEQIWILDFKPVFETEKIAAKLHLPKSSQSARKRLQKLVEKAQTLARPVGCAMVAGVEPGDGENTSVGGEAFSGKLVREKTRDLGRVFPYMCTEGAELADWGNNLDSDADVLLARGIRETAVKQCQAALEEKLLRTYGMKQVSTLNPGSLIAWPIEEQAKLFHLLADVPEKLGVRLLPSMLMQPDFSVSGLFFETEKKYYNCQLCPREGCPNRKAPREQ